jgi:hypothetical protein
MFESWRDRQLFNDVWSLKRGRNFAPFLLRSPFCSCGKLSPKVGQLFIPCPRALHFLYCRHVLWPLRIRELLAAQPSTLEAIPHHHRVELLAELVDTPQAIALDFLAGRIERNAVEAAQLVDDMPVRANVSVLECDMVRARWLPSIVALAPARRTRAAAS